MAMINGLSAQRRLGAILAFARGLTSVLFGALVAACVAVDYRSPDHDHFIAQALWDEDQERIRNEFAARYPKGTPVQKLVDDLTSFGAKCQQQSSPDDYRCVYRQGVREAVVPLFMPLLAISYDTQRYRAIIRIHGRSGVMESVDIEARRLWPYEEPLDLKLGPIPLNRGISYD